MHKEKEIMLQEEIVKVLQQRPLGLLFDIDGTLSPIAPTPDDARLYPGVAELLRRAQKYAHVGIITGRGVVNGARMVNVDGLTYIGNHGLEWCAGLPDQHEVALIPQALPYVEPGKYVLDIAERELADLPGVIVQRKSVGGSIHYRLTPDPEQARIRILATLEAPAKQVQMKLGEGKRVIEVLAPLNINKGQGLRRFVERFELHSIIFAGDDRTDLDAVLEVKKLRQEGFAAHAIVVQHADTLPELLQHADSIVQGVEGMAQQLKEIVDRLERVDG
jgi:trehalose 6-phosphate phosphatase